MFLTSIVKQSNAQKRLKKYRYVRWNILTADVNGPAIYMLKIWDKASVEIPFVNAQVSVSSGASAKANLVSDLATWWSLDSPSDMPCYVDLDLYVPKQVDKLGYVLSGVGTGWDVVSMSVQVRNDPSESWVYAKSPFTVPGPRAGNPNFTMVQLFP